MRKKKDLSDKQKKFLEVLFTREVGGNTEVAAQMAGYSPNSLEWLERSLADEIVNAAKIYLASHAGMAAVTTVNGMIGKADATQLSAARDVFDRGGIAKQAEKPAETAVNNLFILPPKAMLEIIEEDSDAASED